MSSGCQGVKAPHTRYSKCQQRQRAVSTSQALLSVPCRTAVSIMHDDVSFARAIIPLHNLSSSQRPRTTDWKLHMMCMERT
jgi:hypothetical protein